MFSMGILSSFAVDCGFFRLSSPCSNVKNNGKLQHASNNLLKQCDVGVKCLYLKFCPVKLTLLIHTFC